MKDDILDQLYYGRIVPWENNNGSTPEMQAVKEQIDADIQALTAMLPDEGKAVLERLLQNQSTLESTIICEGYKDGFRTGAKLALSTFCSGNES